MWCLQWPFAKLGNFFCNFVQFYYAINNEKADKIDGGSLELGKVLEKEKRGPPLNSVTHLAVEDELINLEEMSSTRQLDKEALILAEQLEKANIKWYYNDKRL